jgi:hypothetical protein
VEKKLEELKDVKEDVDYQIEIAKDTIDRLVKLEADVEKQNNVNQSREADLGSLHKPIEHQVLESGWKDSIEIVPTLEKDIKEQRDLLQVIQTKVEKHESSDDRRKKLEKIAELSVTKIAKLEEGLNDLRDSAKGRNCHGHGEDFRIEELFESNKIMILRLVSLEKKNERHVSKISELEKDIRDLKRSIL